jgi:hypothetical protein
MKTLILAIAAATALSGAAFAQTGIPSSTAPTASSPGTSQSGSSIPSGMNSGGATGSVGPTDPSKHQPRVAPGTPNNDVGVSGSQPYVLPPNRHAPSGDDGGTAGKTNPD